MGDASASPRTRLCLLAARFVLPGPGPRVDDAIRLACSLLVGELDTPATVGVATLSDGTALRDAQPLIRDMLREQGIPVTDPGAGDAEKFAVVLRAFGTGGLGVGEFSAALYASIPAWDEQDDIQRSMVVLLSEWDAETTPERKGEVASAMRTAALTGLGELCI